MSMNKRKPLVKAVVVVVAIAMMVCAAGFVMNQSRALDCHSNAQYERSVIERVADAETPLAAAAPVAEAPMASFGAQITSQQVVAPVVARAAASAPAPVVAPAPVQPEPTEQAPAGPTNQDLQHDLLSWLAGNVKDATSKMYGYFKTRAVNSVMDSTGPNWGDKYVNPEIDQEMPQLAGKDYGWSVTKTSGSDFALLAEVGADMNSLNAGDEIEVSKTTASDPTDVVEGTVDVTTKVVQNGDTKVNETIVTMETATFEPEA